MPTPKLSRLSSKNKTAQEDARSTGDNLVTSHRWAWYGLSVFIPLLGVFIGLFLYDQDSREIRRVGRNALFISFLVWIILPLVLLTGLLLVGVATLAELFSQAFSGGN
jgi:Na+/H+-dicarboxylate symporter